MLRQPVRKAPLFVRLIIGKMGESNSGTTSLSSDGSQPEICSGCLDPRDGSTSSVASQRIAPRVKKETGSFCHVPYPKHFTCENMQKFMQKEFETNSNRARKIQPRNVRVASSFLDAKAAGTENFHINRLLTDSRLL